MSPYRLSFFIFFVLIFTTANAYFGESEEYDSCEDFCHCQNSTIEENDPQELLKIKKYVLGKLAKNNLNHWSDLAKPLKKYLIAYATGDDKNKRNFAQTTIIFAALFDNYLYKKPTTCSIASVINASVPCNKEGDGSKITELVNNIDEFYNVHSYIVNLGRDIVLRRSKCDIDPTLYVFSEDVYTNVCYKNGTVYPIKCVLELKKHIIPPKIQNILLSLYKSKNSNDNFIAAIATYALLKPPARIYNNWDPQALLETLYLWTAKPQPTCCCQKFFEYSGELRGKMKAAYGKAYEDQKNFYANNKVCPNLDR